jgi:proline dehydrogenase
MSVWSALDGRLEKALAGRWIAGAGIDDAILRAEALNSMGMGAILNYLGEEFTAKADVEEAVLTYTRLVNKITRERVVASISVKPTQLGLRIGRRLAERNYSKVVSAARGRNVFVWLDMEAYDTVDATFALYSRQAARKGVGIALQAGLRRSLDDAKRIVGMRGVVRLVKGAYREPERLGFASRSEVTRNYSRIMGYLFRNSSAFTIATHDGSLIREALSLNRSYRRDVTYAMLNGIRNGYAQRLAATNNSVSIYVPFGARWLDYASRRLSERGHAALAIRSMFGG